MPYDVVMPQLGMTMTEGSVVQWFKNLGEAVEKGENLFVVQTDKVDMEMEAPCSGTVTELLVEPGKVVPVGTVIAKIAQPGSVEVAPISNVVVKQSSAPLLAPTTSPNLTTPSSFTGPSIPGRASLLKLASPRAKSLARELGVNLREVPDYSGRGRAVEADVRRFWEERAPIPSTPTSEWKPPVPGVREANSVARRTIAARMTTSVQTIPHFYLDLLVDATELRKIREILLGYIEQQAGVRLTYTDLLLKALAVSLVKHPEFNTYWAPEGIKHRNHISIGFAVQTDERLYVPVVRDADKLSLADLAKARNELVTRARAGKLHLSDLGDASCTLSNLGAYGIDHFHAIINPPESAILAAGRIAARPTVVGESVVARQTIYLSLAVDHRLIDGAAAASFLTAVAGVVESPQNLLLV